MTSRLMWLPLTTTLVVAVATMWLSIRNWQAVGVDPVLAVFAPVPITITVGVGALVVARARNVIGWLLAIAGGLVLLALFAEEYAFYGLISVPSKLPGLTASAWIAGWVAFPSIFAVAAVVLLFPTGRLPSKRWRPVLWALAAGAFLLTVGFAGSPGPLEGGTLDDFGVLLDNPTGVSLPQGLSDATITAGVIALFAGGFLSLMAMAIRYRRASGQERQQIKWLAYLSITAATLMFTSSVLGTFMDVPVVVEGLWVLGLFGFIAGFPITIGMAVLRYGLYEIPATRRCGPRRGPACCACRGRPPWESARTGPPRPSTCRPRRPPRRAGR